MKREAPEDALFSFLNAVNTSLIEPLKKNQIKFALQREIKESKRYQDVENKLVEFGYFYDRVKKNPLLREKVLDTLRQMHATRMTQYFQIGKPMAAGESGDLKAALVPYFDLLQPIEDIRRLQATMMNQGKLKKMPLPYDELTATLTEVSTLAAKMPQILMDGISQLSEALEKVA